GRRPCCAPPWLWARSPGLPLIQVPLQGCPEQASAPQREDSRIVFLQLRQRVLRCKTILRTSYGRLNVTGLTRIRGQIVVYLCLHRGQFAGKHGKLASSPSTRCSDSSAILQLPITGMHVWS